MALAKSTFVEETVLLVNSLQKPLDFLTSIKVLLLVFRAHTKIQRVIALFLLRPFKESGPSTSKSKLYSLMRHALIRAIRIPIKLVALINDPLHISTFGANNSPSHLELILIFNLDLVPASQFDILLILLIQRINVLSLI